MPLRVRLPLGSPTSGIPRSCRTLEQLEPHLSVSFGDGNLKTAALHSDADVHE